MWTRFSLLGKASNHYSYCVFGNYWYHQMALVMLLRIWWWHCGDLGLGPPASALLTLGFSGYTVGRLYLPPLLLREGCDTVILITSVMLTNHLCSTASILVHIDEMFWVVTVYMQGCFGCDCDQPTMNWTPSFQWPHCVFYIAGLTFFTCDVILWSSDLLLDLFFGLGQ